MIDCRWHNGQTCVIGGGGGRPSAGYCRQMCSHRVSIPPDAPVIIPATVAVPLPTPRPRIEALPLSQWPRLARWVASLRRDGESGVGDTVHRLLAPTGAEAVAARWPKLANRAGFIIMRMLGPNIDSAVVHLMGKTCGCADRKAKLNATYRY